MQHYKIMEYTMCIKKRKKFEQLQKRSIERDVTLWQNKIKQRNDPRKWTAIYAIVIFFRRLCCNCM